MDRELYRNRRFILLLFAAILLSGVLFAQPVVTPARVVFDSVSVGEFAVDSYHLGVRNIEGMVVINSPNHFFTVSLRENTGFRRRLIVEPNEGNIDQTIYVRFAPGRGGEERGELIHISRELNERVSVALFGTGYETENQLPIRINAEQIEFGEVTIGEQETDSYLIGINGLRSRLIIRSNNPQVRISFDEEGEFLNHLVIDPTDQVFRQTVYVRYAPRVAGQVRAAIFHHIQGTHIQIPLPVTGMGIGDDNNAPRLVIRPEIIEFGEVTVGRTANRSYGISANNIRGRLIIASMNPQVTISLAEDGEYTQRLEINPDDGDIRRAVYVRYAPRAAVPLRAAIVHHIQGTPIRERLAVTGMGIGDDDDNAPRIVIRREIIEFGEVTVGRTANESYGISANNIPGRLIIATNNPQVTISLTEEGEYTQRLEINPDNGDVRLPVHVRYAPRAAVPLRAAIVHHIQGTPIREQLPVTGMGIGDDNQEPDQPIAINPQRINFDEVTVGRAAHEIYTINGADIRGNLRVVSGNPMVTLSLSEEGEFTRYLEIIPNEGVIRRNVYIRYAPRIAGDFRTQIIHTLPNANLRLLLSVTGTAVDPERNDNLDADPEYNVSLQTELLGNYPNPFNPETTISFSLEHDSRVELVVYNLLGQKIATLENGNLTQGKHSYLWRGWAENGEQVQSGVYLYNLKTDDADLTGRMILLK